MSKECYHDITTTQNKKVIEKIIIMEDYCSTNTGKSAFNISRLRFCNLHERIVIFCHCIDAESYMSALQYI